MKKKVIWLSIAAVAVVVLALLGFKAFQIWSAMNMKFEMPPESITSMIVKEEPWRPTLKAVGSLQAVNGMVVTADLPGLVKQIAFESGARVKKGDVLVQIDVQQEQTLLLAAEAKRKLSELNLQRSSDLFNKRVSSKSDYDAALAEYQQSEARVREVQAMIERKTIRAPFDGVLGIREVNLGEYLESGKKIVPLQSLDPIYVNFSVPQHYLDDLKIGETVRIHAPGIGQESFEGKINAINSMVDEATRNIQVQATLSNINEKLRAGMFVDVQVPLPGKDKVIVVPSSAISYAPYGDSVFVVEDMTDKEGKSFKGAKQVFVKVGQTRGDQVAILSGLTVGQELVTSGVFKLRSDVKVLVNNEVEVPNNPNPTPEDA